MKILRWLIGIIIGLFILIVAAVVLLVNFINPNDYRDQISKAVSDAIHQPFVIQGDIHWKIFPSLGFKINDMSVGTPAGKDLYASVKNLSISLQVLPLLHKQTVIEALMIDGLQLTLPANKETVEKSSASSSAATAAASPATTMAAISAASLQALSIENANISQLALDGKLAWAIKNLSLDAKDIRINDAFPLNTSFTFVYPEKNISTKIKESENILWDMDKQVLTVSDISLSMNNEQKNSLPITLNSTVSKIAVDFAKQVVNVNKLSGSFNELNFVSDNINLKDYASDLSASGDLNLQTPSLRSFLKTLAVDLPPAVIDPTVATKFSLKTNYQYGRNRLSLSPLNIQLDQNIITGSVNSPDVKNMAINTSLQSPALNIAGVLMKGLQLSMNLLPPPGENKNWAASAINGNVRLQSATYTNQIFNNLELQVDGKDQIIKLLKLHTNAFRGSIDAPGVIMLQGDAPKFNLKPNIQGVQIEDVLKVVEPKFKLTGLASIEGTVSGQGNDAASIEKTLNGNLKVAVKNGVLHGINVGYWLSVASQLYQSPNIQTLQSLPAPAHGGDTPFGNLTASLNINQGIISNQDLLLQGPVAVVKGQGTIDLNRQALNYRLWISKTNQATGKAHSDVMPLIITGSFDNPSVRPDMDAIAKQALSNVVNKQKDRLAQKLNDQLGQQLGDQVGQQVGQALGKLFGS
jgi:AsmA protein